MKKTILRSLYISKRNALSEKDYNKKNKDIANLFLNHFILSREAKIHIYLSKNEDREVDTWTIIHELQKKKINISVPKIKNNDIKNCILASNAILKKNKWGIEEPVRCKILDPKEIEIIIIPALICDSRGYRIGYGGGYYDRFLKECNSNTKKIVLNFFEPIYKVDDICQYDIPVNYCVTPDKIINFEVWAKVWDSHLIRNILFLYFLLDIFYFGRR